jgi:hypothetical protein
MPAKPPAGSVPPVEPTPAVAPPVPVIPAATVAPPVPPVPAASAAPPVPDAPKVDPYAATQPYPPPPPPPPVYVAQPGQPYAPPYTAGYYAPPQAPRGLAIASMVTGIVGVFFALIEGIGFLPSLAAVITGHIARKRQPEARGMWMTGLICGYIGLGISLIWIVVLIGIFVIAVASVGPGGGFDNG